MKSLRERCSARALRFSFFSSFTEMYLTSFIHREKLFRIAERWLCGCPDPGDVRALTGILICDGFVIGETLEVMAKRLLGLIHERPVRQKRISFKGELRDRICLDAGDADPRMAELAGRYRENPDYYYREAPINGVMCLDEQDRLIGLFRIKRPKRIAEKANRRIADWIFEKVLGRAREMAGERARLSGVPLDSLVTSEEEMAEEFIRAEEFIAWSFRDRSIRLERSAMTMQDVGGIKIVGSEDELLSLEKSLAQTQDISVTEREQFSGSYRATNLVLEITWDAEDVCRKYRESRSWGKYLDRGIPEEELKKGLEPLLVDAEPKINVELILSTFPDVVESELGNSIHEERIIAQRENKRYKGYIPMNVELLVESLFAVGFSPRTDIDRVPVKIWGRYLPETLSLYVQQLYNLPEHDLFY
ncbi:MAG: hypothetical protein HQL09_08870 [Nitrospirae bacterium]|nr:hypothetical protein [Nitrospirota bacterium]